MAFLFKMHGILSSLSIGNETKIAYFWPSVLIIMQLLNSIKQLPIFKKLRDHHILLNIRQINLDQKTDPS